MGAGTPLRTAGGPGSVGDGPGVDGTLVEVARAAVAGGRGRGGDDGWGVDVEGFWCTVRPPGQELLPRQGWKLHVSAAAEVAVEVLAAVAAAIAEDPCPFKFAADREKLHGPDGTRTEDVRTPSYRCPPWAVDPVEGRGPTNPGRRRPEGVLLGGRYALTAAVRHGAKGGVFLGRDTGSGAEVVVKQARAHIEVDRAGTDARTALRHEARLLDRLDGLQLTPRALELIEHRTPCSWCRSASRAPRLWADPQPLPATAESAA